MCIFMYNRWKYHPLRQWMRFAWEEWRSKLSWESIKASSQTRITASFSFLRLSSIIQAAWRFLAQQGLRPELCSGVPTCTMWLCHWKCFFEHAKWIILAKSRFISHLCLSSILCCGCFSLSIVAQQSTGWCWAACSKINYSHLSCL